MVLWFPSLFTSVEISGTLEMCGALVPCYHRNVCVTLVPCYLGNLWYFGSLLPLKCVVLGFSVTMEISGTYIGDLDIAYYKL